MNGETTTPDQVHRLAVRMHAEVHATEGTECGGWPDCPLPDEYFATYDAAARLLGVLPGSRLCRFCGVVDDVAPGDPDVCRATPAAVVALGGLALTFGRVDRITYHQDGFTPESDTDHTVMLGLIACAFAAEYLPWLDAGLIAQFALVHDVVEAYAGDTPTLRITAVEQASKAEREAAALDRLRSEFGECLPWLPNLIETYEAREVPEARYVKAMDKVVPKITHLLNHGCTLRDQGMSRADVADRYDRQAIELMTYAADFPPLLALRAELVARLLDMLPDPGRAAA